MRQPTENAVVQFSGGRTSAYMLRHLLDHLHGGLPATWKVCFENTGKEREETLEFIEEVSQRWGVPITWLEYDDYFDIQDYTKPDGTLRPKKLRPNKFKVVDFKTASRNGEPFTKMLDNLAAFRKAVKGLPPVLPNPVQRICTANLKVKILWAFLRFTLGWEDFTTYMGIRKDEEHRAHKLISSTPVFQSVATPLIDLGITKPLIMDFWDHQPFDLKLDRNSDEGNCDLCFLKATGKLIKIMQADRSKEQWWIDRELTTGQTFSKSKPTFVQLRAMLDTNDPKLQKWVSNPLDKTIDCFCGE